MKLLKTILGSFLIGFLLVTALSLPVWYIYSQGNQFVADAEKSAENRSKEMAITLNTISGESLYYDNLIALSSTLATVVKQGIERNDPFKIQEIYVVDKSGALIAHSDISKMASESATKYDSQIGNLRFKSDPVIVEVTERVKPDYGSLINTLGLTKVFDYLLNQILPNLTASRYHVTGTIYQPDDDNSSGSIHLLVQNQNAATILNQYISMVLKVLAVAVIGSIALWIVFTIIMAVFIFSPDHSPSSGVSAYPNFELTETDSETIIKTPNPNMVDLNEYRDRKKVVNQNQNLAESDNSKQSQIYDAIPVERHL